jgi:iron complex outermembrane recepter protein
MKTVRALFLLLTYSLLTLLAAAQTGGTIRGRVITSSAKTPLPLVSVLLVQPNRSVETAGDGSFEFQNVPPGEYDVAVAAAGFAAEIARVSVTADGRETLEFQLKVSPISQDITSTANGREVPAARAFRTVNTLDSFDLAQKNATSLGVVLQDEPGVATRSFGPGTSRPVIRGFDGDHVLIMEDGIRTGTLSSQSADHGEPIDVLAIERLEVLKGPATLLYGSEATGGVVNAISGRHQFKEGRPSSFHTTITTSAGSVNRAGAGAIAFDYGFRNWRTWGSAANQKTGDYRSAHGRVDNSGSRLTNGVIGAGWYGHSKYGAVSYEYGDGILGIPLTPGVVDETTGDISRAIPVDVSFFRRNVRLSGGMRDFRRWIDGARASVAYTSWNHVERELLVNPSVRNTFVNKDYTFQLFVDQKRHERWNGTVGIYGTRKKFSAGGLDPVAPGVRKDSAAVFALEELGFDVVRLQFSGRFEYTKYRPDQPEPVVLPAPEPEPEPKQPEEEEEGADTPEPEPAAPIVIQGFRAHRRFTAASGAIGISVPAWRNGTLVANFSHSYRPPALHELYNDGPHAGSGMFEIGNDNLDNERTNGIEVSVRHLTNKLRANGSYYFNRVDGLVFLAATGNQRENLTEAAFVQNDALYSGFEGGFDAQLRPAIWFSAGADYVWAELRETKTPLPRIPPLRGRAGFDFLYRGITIKPEVVIADAQHRLYSNETRTPGYTTFNLRMSYTIIRANASHHIALNGFNLANRFYLNHLSFIKDTAPEARRGVKVTYSVRFH